MIAIATAKPLEGDVGSAGANRISVHNHQARGNAMTSGAASKAGTSMVNCDEDASHGTLTIDVEQDQKEGLYNC